MFGSNEKIYIRFLLKSTLARVCILAVFSLFLCPTGTAWAALAPGTSDDGTMGGLLCQYIVPNAGMLAELFTMVAWAAAAVFVVMGIHHFRLHNDSPSNNPLTKPIALWGGAGGLFAMPQVVETIVTSVYGGSVPEGGLACTDTSPAAGGGTPGLDQMLATFVGNIEGPLLHFISGIAFLCGTYMVLRSLMQASKYGFDPKTNSVHSILTHMGFGALLLAISSNLDVMLGSVFGANSPTATNTAALAQSNALSWNSSITTALGGASQQFQTAVTAGLNFFQIIGVIAFVRGWLIMKKVVEGGGNVTMAQGITHIFGGVLAINIFTFLKIMDTTFGTNLLT